MFYKESRMSFCSNELIAKLKSYYPKLDENNNNDVENALMCVISGFRDNFSSNMRKIRASLQMSQMAAAELFNVAYPSFNAWENGRAVPRLSKIKEICKGYKIDPSDLIEVNPVSPDTVFDRHIPLINLDFFKAVSFPSAFRNFALLDMNKQSKILSEEFGLYDFAVPVKVDNIIESNKIKPKDANALCSWKELAGKEQIEQMKIADGKLALVSIVYNKVCFREVHFDGKFLTLKAWKTSEDDFIFPMVIEDVDLMEDPEKAKYCGHITPAAMVQIFAIVKRCVLSFEKQ